MTTVKGGNPCALLGAMFRAYSTYGTTSLQYSVGYCPRYFRIAPLKTRITTSAYPLAWLFPTVPYLMDTFSLFSA